jgi:hypothetical protein
MKALFAFGLSLLLAAGGTAQMRARSFVSAGVAAPRQAASSVTAQPTRPLGAISSNASSRPLGGVALPTFPGNTPATSNVRHTRRASTTARSIGPVYYVPNSFDAGYDYAPSDGGPAYIQQRPRPVRQMDDQTADEPANALVNPGDPIGPASNYYLIAYKDHTVYSALAYWIEGETLHYVTMQNTHNQASLALIDLDQTTTLNSDRSVPFSITGR